MSENVTKDFLLLRFLLLKFSQTLI